MKRLANLAIAFSLGTMAAVSTPALAQADAAAAAPTGGMLAVGTTVYDSAGTVIGNVTSNDGTNVVIENEGNQVALPIVSFGKGEQGPALTITLEQLQAGIAQQKAAAQAAVDAALQPGASVMGINGTAVLGTVKSTDADGVVLTTTSGDVRLPKNSFLIAAHGLSSSFTAEQFAAAIAQATPEAAPATDAAADSVDSAEAAPAATAE